MLLRWDRVEKYIDLMIQSDRYLSDKERRAIDFPLELNAASAAEYTALKAQHPDTLVGFEAGGNFMFYGEDAHNQNTTTKVIWHGGEPMLIKPQLMEQVMLDQLQKGHDIRWEMQSNGTLVTDEHIRVFQKYNVSVGVSIDGLKKHHDKYRVFKNGNPTYDVIMKNTQRLRNSGISCGTLLTITDENVNDLSEIYQELCKKNLNFSFNALFPSKADDDDVTLNDNNYARKICELFDTWIQDEKNGIGIYKLFFFALIVKNS